MKYRGLFVFQMVFLLNMYIYAQDEVRPDLKEFFDEYNLTGSFVMFDRTAGKWTRYEPDKARKQVVPASTFKIVNTLIALETGVIPDENYIFKWNGEQRTLSSWERNLKLSEAFAASCVPCYQDIARAIGPERMQKHLDKLQYGNQSMSGGIDRFWLTGGLRISADEQVKFLMELYDEKLPLSPRSMRIVKSLMLRDNTPRYKLYGKTGWQTDDLANPNGKSSLGWFVGYQERAGNVYFFAANFETKSTQGDFAAARVDITKRILKLLCVLE